jgi:hypothetical protein
MLRARLAAALVTAAMLVLPAAALADSAGDNQYQDPFAGTPSQPKQPKQQPSGTQGGSTQTPAAPAPTPAPAQTTAAPAATPTQTGTLPRTGFPLLPVAAVGAALLAAGILLRRLV